MHDTGLPPAGWYPDGAEVSLMRWWDGAAWTAHTAARASAPSANATQDPAPLTRRALRDQLGPLTVAEPEVATVHGPGRALEVARASQPSDQVVAQPAAQLAGTAVLEHPPTDIAGPRQTALAGYPAGEPQEVRAPQYSTPDYVIGDDDADISSAERMRRAAGYAPRAPDAEPAPAEWRTGAYHASPEPARKRSAQSLSGWLFAFSPLWLGGINIFVRLFGQTSDAIPQWIAANLIALVLTFGLAFTDGRRLAANGYRTTSPGWVLIPIVYFILRVSRVGTRSIGMLVVRLLLDGGYFVLVALVFGVLMSQGAFGSFGAGFRDGVTGGSGTSQSQPQDQGQNQGFTHDSGGGTALTADQRAYLLTPEGVERKLRYDLAGVNQNVDSLACEPFSSTAADTLTSCVLQSDGITYDLVLRVSPEFPDVAFVLEKLTPRDGNSSQDTQQS